MADKVQRPGPAEGGKPGPGGADAGHPDYSDGDRFLPPDLEGARAIAEDVGALPVPRSVRESKGERLPPDTGAPYDLERGLQPGARRPIRPAQAQRGQRNPDDLDQQREEESQLRRSLPRAARTPEQLGAALSRIGASGLRDPQRGREAGPPLPGEAGYSGDE